MRTGGLTSRQTDMTKLLIDFHNFVSARNLNGVCSITNALSLSVEGQVKISWNQAMESVGYAPVFSHCSLLRNPRLKPTGVLEHCREGENSCWFSIFRGVSF